MALTGKKYEKFYKTTGTGDDKIDSSKLTFAEEMWDVDRAIGMRDHLDNMELAPIIFQLQQIQDELDYLRTEISANKDKTGISTSQANAIVANTAKDGITKAQADAIVANTAKTSMVIGRRATEAMAGNTPIPIPTVTTGRNIEVLFDNLKVGFKSTTIDLKVTDTSTRKTYSATIILQ